MGRNSGIASRPTAYRRRNIWLWRALAGLMVLAVAAVVGVSVYVGWSLSHPAPRPVDRTPAEVGLAYESVAFPATDGLTIRAWFLPAEDSSSTIIMAHGYTSNRLSPSLPALELARVFCGRGLQRPHV